LTVSAELITSVTFIKVMKRVVGIADSLLKIKCTLETIIIKTKTILNLHLDVLRRRHDTFINKKLMEYSDLVLIKKYQVISQCISQWQKLVLSNIICLTYVWEKMVGTFK